MSNELTERILGIDTGTNSLGWAVVEYHHNEAAEGEAEADLGQYKLIKCGVEIFDAGVGEEKGNEFSKAAERTSYKRLRIGYWRRKVRKIALLKILVANRLCPPVSDDELRLWRLSGTYPKSNEAFMTWLKTDDKEDKNPYYYRNLCLSQRLDLNRTADRYAIGRAIYHLNQRRGFLSNRKEETRESDGAVSKGISELDSAMAQSQCTYLGQYFFKLYQQCERIRCKYTSRKEHYEKELLRICELQGLSQDVTNCLRKTIIEQRPLKSQKHAVGHCVFEPSRTRCPLSHPLYEQYRMYAFINNIKIQTPDDSQLRPLTVAERDKIKPLFLKVRSKTTFDFKEIAKALSRTRHFGYYNDKPEPTYKFNYLMDESVASCPVTAALSKVFGVDGSDENAWLDAACEVYTQGGGKTRFEIMNDIWHALFFFEDSDKLSTFGREKLQLDTEAANRFASIKLPSDYASLSLKAMRKILPYMKEYGMIYSHAVFLANIPSAIHCPVIEGELGPVLPPEDANDIINVFYEYDPDHSELTREQYVKAYITHKYRLDDNEARQLCKLYHPSMIEKFPKVRDTRPEGYYQLGSPRTDSLRNPMAMRSLFRIRHVVNALLREGTIDEETTIRIEFARELNDANRRQAIKTWQRGNEQTNEAYRKRIIEYKGAGYTPSDIEILKMKLWEEQNHICLYTGKTISIADLFNGNAFDIEHTIPRSLGGDSTDMNLTLCDSRYNRETKRTMLPALLPNHDEVMERIAHWKETCDKLSQEIRKLNTRGVTDKEMKDRILQKRYRLLLERDYYRGKYQRFTMTEVPEGFSRRQGVDISVISRYACQYLKSLFRRVFTVKGLATSDFRKIWGLQAEYEKKARTNHCHHAIDAVTIACIGPAQYGQLAHYYHDEERQQWGLDSQRASFPKPWPTFTEDVKRLPESLLVVHYTNDNIGKVTRKRVKVRGRATGAYMTGDTARYRLHKETYYGAIERDGKLQYVVRRNLADAKVDDIIDDAVREKVKQAVQEHGSLKKAAEAGVWMNKEKGIRINKVRVKAKPTEPLHIRLHRDVSAKEYKRQYYVENDGNYLIAIYEGCDKNGKKKRSFIPINVLDAVNYFNSDARRQGGTIVPPTDSHGYALKYPIRNGIMVLLYEESPEEVYESSPQDLCARLYKVKGIEKNSPNSYRIKLWFHQLANDKSISDSSKKSPKAFYKHRDPITSRLLLRISTSKFKALIQGKDFDINDLGEIRFLHR